MKDLFIQENIIKSDKNLDTHFNTEEKYIHRSSYK